jgi:hypothetical protein
MKEEKKKYTPEFKMVTVRLITLEATPSEG